MATKTTQRKKLLDYMARHPLARARDLRALGISGTAISRAAQDANRTVSRTILLL